MKTERTQIHFLSDVLTAVASLDLKVSNDTYLGSLRYSPRDTKTYTRVEVDFTCRVFYYVRSHVNSLRVNES